MLDFSSASLEIRSKSCATKTQSHEVSQKVTESKLFSSYPGDFCRFTASRSSDKIVVAGVANDGLSSASLEAISKTPLKEELSFPLVLSGQPATRSGGESSRRVLDSRLKRSGVTTIFETGSRTSRLNCTVRGWKPPWRGTDPRAHRQ